MKKNSSTTYQYFQLAAILLLGGGFAAAGMWPVVLVIAVVILFRLFTRRLQSRVISWAVLVMFTGIAAFGVLNQVSAYLMIAGVTAALAGWELEDCHLQSAKTSTSGGRESFENYHLKMVCLAAAAGLILSEAGLFIHYSLPFGVIFLAVVTVLFGIFQLFLVFKKS
jgi:hypothetical protein